MTKSRLWSDLVVHQVQEWENQGRIHNDRQCGCVYDYDFRCFKHLAENLPKTLQILKKPPKSDDWCSLGFLVHVLLKIDPGTSYFKCISLFTDKFRSYNCFSDYVYDMCVKYDEFQQEQIEAIATCLPVADIPELVLEYIVGSAMARLSASPNLI